MGKVIRHGQALQSSGIGQAIHHKIHFTGYENFVYRIDTGGSEDCPSWMWHVSFSDLKLKLIGSIVAISGIELLKYFINVKEVSTHELSWAVGIHLTLVFSGVMFALMDRISGSTHGKE